MSFTRLDELRSSYHGMERRGRGFFKKSGESPLQSPMFRRKQFSFEDAASTTSSRDSSLDRRQFRFTDIVDRVSPRLMHVMRSGSFSGDADSKRKRWLGRSESLKSEKNWFSASTPSEVRKEDLEVRRGSLDSPTSRRRRRLLHHTQSLREPCSNHPEDPGKVKGFVNR